MMYVFGQATCFIVEYHKTSFILSFIEYSLIGSLIILLCLYREYHWNKENNHDKF